MIAVSFPDPRPAPDLAQVAAGASDQAATVGGMSVHHLRLTWPVLPGFGWVLRPGAALLDRGFRG